MYDLDYAIKVQEKNRAKFLEEGVRCEDRLLVGPNGTFKLSFEFTVEDGKSGLPGS